MFRYRSRRGAPYPQQENTKDCTHNVTNAFDAATGHCKRETGNPLSSWLIYLFTMNYERVLSDLRHENALRVRYEGQTVAHFRWESTHRQYLLPFGERLPVNELGQVKVVTDAVFVKDARRQLKRLKQQKLTRAQWQESMEKLCAEHFKLQFLIENGGLDSEFEPKAKAQFEDFYFLEKAREQSANDDRYIADLGREVESGRLGPGLEFGNFETRVLALFGDDIIKYSEYHVAEPPLPSHIREITKNDGV